MSLNHFLCFITQSPNEFVRMYKINIILNSFLKKNIIYTYTFKSIFIFIYIFYFR